MKHFLLTSLTIAVLLFTRAGIVQSGETIILKLKDGSQITALSIHDAGTRLEYTTTEGLPGFVSKELVTNIGEIFPRDDVQQNNVQGPEEKLHPTVTRLKNGHSQSKKEVPFKLIRHTDQLMASGQYELAEKEFEAMTRVYPHDPLAYHQLGRIAIMRDRDLQKAISLYNEALSRNPTSQEIYLHRAEAYQSLGDCAAAIADCNKVLGLTPKNGDAFKLRAECLQDEGNTAGAVADYKRAIKYRPTLRRTINVQLAEMNVKNGVTFPELANDEDFLMWRSFFFVADKEFELAIKDLKTLIRIDSNNSTAYYKIGDIYESRYHDYPKAIQNYSQAIALDRSEPKYLFGRGRSYYFSEQWEPALVDFTEYISIARDNKAGAYYYRGMCHKHLNQETPAKEDLLKAKELDQGWAQGADRALSDLL